MSSAFSQSDCLIASIGMVTVASPLLPPQFSSVEAVFSLNLNSSTPIHFKMIGSRENYGTQFPM